MSDYDRSKFYGKKKFPTSSRDSNNFGSRFFNSKTTAKEGESSEKPKNIKKTTILAREHHVEDRSVSPKTVTKDEPTQPITIANAAHSENVQNRCKQMTKCAKLLEDGVICPENIQEFLQENDDYLAVGVVGGQGVGKSTILNLLAHNSVTESLKKSIFKYPKLSNENKENVTILSESEQNANVKDKIADVIFKPQSTGDIASNSNGTNGIDFFVTHNRVMFLDCQPFSSLAILDDLIRSENKLANMANEFLPLENVGEILNLQMTAFLMSVCHVIILVQDWFFDSNFLRFMQSAEMLKPTISNPEDEQVDHFPHLILVHNKAQMDDFSPIKFKQMQKLYKLFFNKTKMHLESGMGIGCGRIINSLSTKNCGDPINLYLIPVYSEKSEHLYQGHPGLEELIKNLRANILGATKYPLNNTNEKHWLLYCSKVWDHVKKSNFFIEYNKLMA